MTRVLAPTDMLLTYLGRKSEGSFSTSPANESSPRVGMNSSFSCSSSGTRHVVSWEALRARFTRSLALQLRLVILGLLNSNLPVLLLLGVSIDSLERSIEDERTFQSRSRALMFLCFLELLSYSWRLIMGPRQAVRSLAR